LRPYFSVSCTKIAAARRPGTEGQFLRHVLWHVLRNALRHVLRHVLDVLVLLSPKESVGSGGR